MIPNSENRLPSSDHTTFTNAQLASLDNLASVVTPSDFEKIMAIRQKAAQRRTEIQGTIDSLTAQHQNRRVLTAKVANRPEHRRYLNEKIQKAGIKNQELSKKTKEQLAILKELNSEEERALAPFRDKIQKGLVAIQELGNHLDDLINQKETESEVMPTSAVEVTPEMMEHFETVVAANPQGVINLVVENPDAVRQMLSQNYFTPDMLRLMRSYLATAEQDYRMALALLVSMDTYYKEQHKNKLQPSLDAIPGKVQQRAYQKQEELLKQAQAELVGRVSRKMQEENDKLTVQDVLNLLVLQVEGPEIAQRRKITTAAKQSAEIAATKKHKGIVASQAAAQGSIIAAEYVRKAVEAAEQERLAAEQARVAAEQERLAAEQARLAAEAEAAQRRIVGTAAKESANVGAKKTQNRSVASQAAAQGRIFTTEYSRKAAEAAEQTRVAAEQVRLAAEAQAAQRLSNHRYKVFGITAGMFLLGLVSQYLKSPGEQVTADDVKGVAPLLMGVTRASHHIAAGCSAAEKK